MKKFLLLFSLFLIPALSKSQPVLSSSSLPEIGTGITRYFCDTTGVNEGQGGADRSWNFSDIQKNNEPAMEVTYIEPSETPYASNFPTANIAIDQDTLFSFYENSSNQIVRLGIQGEDIKETLTDTEISLTLPFTYGDTHSDTFEGTIETTIQGTPYTMNRSGSLTAEADAYGSITLPTGTFNNVLRVKHTYVLEDELPVVIPGMPSPIMITEVISYDWMHPDFYYPVFSISYNTLSYENFPGMEDLESMSVHYTSTEPASGDIPLPSITAPVDGATGVSLPVELSWVVPESGKTKEKGNTDLDQNYQSRVQVAEDIDFNSIRFEEAKDGNSATVDGLEHSTTYYWRVRLEEGQETGDWTEVNSFTTGEAEAGLPALDYPEDKQEDLETTIEFRWSSEESHYYSLEVALDPMFENIVFQDTTFEESLTVFSLEYNTTYYWRVAIQGDAGWVYTNSYEFTTLDPSSVIISPEEAGISIYPNPVDNKVDIESREPIKEISLMSLDGKELMKKKQSNGLTNITLDLGNYAGGTYLLIVNSGNNISAVKIIKR